MCYHLSLLCFVLNLLSLLQDFDRIVLDEAVLGVARMFREELVECPMMRITTDPIGMQPTARIPFGHMADLELGSDV